MELTINIPDWAEDKNIYVLAGIELLAYKYVGHPMKEKVSRCDQCGDCCRNFKGDGSTWTDGTCNYLRDNVCSLGVERPFSCGMPNDKFDCAEVFK